MDAARGQRSDQSHNIIVVQAGVQDVLSDVD